MNLDNIPLHYKGHCPNCGKDFRKKHVAVKYCSDLCRWQNETNKAQNKSHSFKIFKRDNFACFYCGRTAKDDKVKLVLDHLYPYSLGGDDSMHNLITSCETCNSQKNSDVLDKKTMRDFFEHIYKRNEQLSYEEYKELHDYFEKKLLNKLVKKKK